MAAAAAAVEAFSNATAKSTLSHFDALAGGPPYELVPTPLSYPIYYTPNTQYLSWISDKDLSLLTPVLVYWLASAFFETLDWCSFPFFEKYRIHEPEEVKKRNKVSATKVFWMVVIQQIIQTALGYWALDENEAIHEAMRDHRVALQTYGAYISRAAFIVLGPSNGSKLLRYCGAELTSWVYWWGVPTVQFLWAR